LKLLTGGVRDAPARRQTIRVLDGLAALLDKSFLKQEAGADGKLRFTMLETIHEYALERLEQSGEANIIRQRHATYFLAFAGIAEPQLHGSDQMVRLSRLEQEHDNLRAVLTWSLAADDQQAIGARLATGLSQFWLVHVHHREGIIWFDRLLSQPMTRFSVVRARALIVAGMLAENQTEFRQATAWLEQSVALYRILDDAA
jgi:predicted ATPase